MLKETVPSPAFHFYSALCVLWVFVAVPWWAFLIVSPERYTFRQWMLIAFGPPLVVIVRGVYMRYVWGWFTRWFWGRPR
jgi:hypothetical protein